MKKSILLISILLVVLLGGYIAYERFYTQTNNPAPVTQSSNTQTSGQNTQVASGYTDGQYTGNAVNAFYGTVQVQATVSGGKITDVKFLQYPNGAGHTIQLSTQVMPELISEAIQAQSANVSVISGATQTSQGFMQSLVSALAQAGATNQTNVQVTAPKMGM